MRTFKEQMMWQQSLSTRLFDVGQGSSIGFEAFWMQHSKCTAHASDADEIGDGNRGGTGDVGVDHQGTVGTLEAHDFRTPSANAKNTISDGDVLAVFVCVFSFNSILRPLVHRRHRTQKLLKQLLHNKKKQGNNSDRFSSIN